MDRKIAWAQYGAEDLAKLEKISADYKEYLDLCKTEREASPMPSARCVSTATSAWTKLASRV